MEAIHDHSTVPTQNGSSMKAMKYSAFMAAATIALLSPKDDQADSPL
ncbi:MAG: hypothetical protein WCP85_18020 [Mariniphaga sp.]